jgi:2-hydroxy-3-oxopropionate reductase
MAQNIGVIGLGMMGRYYLQRLQQTGYAVCALDVNAERLRWAQEQGATIAVSPRHMAEACDVILLAVPGNREVQEVMEAENGVFAALRPGHLLVNTSTTHPRLDEEMAQRCAERDAAWIDAPVTWRAQGLIVMAGGEQEHVARAMPILEAIAYKVAHVGEVGAGQRLKAVNQLIGACQLAVWCEAAEFARSIGLSPEIIRDVLDLPIPDNVLGEDFAGSGQLALHYKDLGYILELAHEYEAAVPLTSIVHEVFKAVRHLGEPNWTQPGIVTYWRRMNRRQDARR